MQNFVSMTRSSLQISDKIQTKIKFRLKFRQNCRNFRTSDDIGMRLGPVTKLDKRNKIISKKNDDEAMSENCDVILIFHFLGLFGAVQNLDSGHRVRKTHFFINSNLLSYKN